MWFKKIPQQDLKDCQIITKCRFEENAFLISYLISDDYLLKFKTIELMLLFLC